MIITTRKHSYFVNELSTVELGSTVLDLENNKIRLHMDPVTAIESFEELAEVILTGGDVVVTESIDAPSAFVVTADTKIVNNAEITVIEDTVGDGVFCVAAGTLTLDGSGTINGVGKNKWNMAVWAKDNGKVVINDGLFTNVGAVDIDDPAHFDLIYASGYAQVEINGGEFKCETPAWTLNIKDKDRATASIVVKGGKFHGFNPADCASEGEHTNFVAPGYKVVEENNVFTVIAE